MKKISTTCRLTLVVVMMAALPSSPAATQAEVEHQPAPLREAKLEIKDFSYPTLEGTVLNLREQTRGQRLVLITYFAAWCHNSNYDVETINQLYAKYHEQGLAVVGVCEYSSVEELRGFIALHHPAYPICQESTDQLKDPKATSHHRYRKQVDDKRKWGTPFSLLISAPDLSERGETLAKKVRVAAGELIKTEVEDFIRAQLAN